MNIKIKPIIKSSLLSGLTFASLMAVNNYYGSQEFKVRKFLINFLIFGVLYALLINWNQNQLNKENENE